MTDGNSGVVVSEEATREWDKVYGEIRKKNPLKSVSLPVPGADSVVDRQPTTAIPRGQSVVANVQSATPDNAPIGSATVQEGSRKPSSRTQRAVPTVPPATPPNSPGGGGSQGNGGSSQPTWYRFMLVLAALITGTGSVYVALNDTPPLRAENEKIFLLNQGRESDVAIEKEKTKQVQANPALAPNQPKTSERRGVTLIGNEGQHLLATGMQFIFSGNGGDSPDAIIAIKQVPTSYSGAFKMFSKGKTSWSPSWSEDQPPYPLSQLLEESKSSEGNVQWMQLFSNGKTQFNM